MEEIIHFLKKLRENNQREWFHAHKKDYQKARKTYEGFVEMIIAGIKSFDPAVGFLSPKECIFRINRDIRFSNNKDPYKTNFGALIAPGGKKSLNAGYYLHLEPGSSFLGGGIYMPESRVLKAIRTEIYNEPEEFRSLVENPGFKKYYTEIYGEKLKTAPKGFPKDFRHIDLLRYKNYAVIHAVDDRFWESEDFMDQTLKAFRALYPLNRYLNDIVQNMD